MRLSEMLARSTRPKRRRRRKLPVIEKAAHLATPIVLDHRHRRNKLGAKINPKTVRSQRTRKRVAAWNEKYGVLV